MKSRVAAALICTVSVAGAALAVGVVAEPSGYWMGSADAAGPATLSGGKVVAASAVAKLLQKGGAVVVDASRGDPSASHRPEGLAPGAVWLPVEHRSLPGALWIPGIGDGTVGPALEAFYRDRLAAATGGDLDRPIIVYCHERCWLSWNAAKRALAFGYRHVYWFAGGIEAWTRAGGATATTASLQPAPRPTMVVLDLELSGDLGGPEFAVEHAARLEAESSRLRKDLEQSQLYRVLDVEVARTTLERLKSQQLYLHDCNGCDLDVGRELHADLVFVAWVNRVSGLILTLTYEIHDVATGQIKSRKSYDFRGDNDSAWNHAIDYMVRDLKSTEG